MASLTLIFTRSIGTLQPTRPIPECIGMRLGKAWSPSQGYQKWPGPRMTSDPSLGCSVNTILSGARTLTRTRILGQCKCKCALRRIGPWNQGIGDPGQDQSLHGLLHANIFSSYLHNGISYSTGKMASLYWISLQGEQCCTQPQWPTTVKLFQFLPVLWLRWVD